MLPEEELVDLLEHPTEWALPIDPVVLIARARSRRTRQAAFGGALALMATAILGGVLAVTAAPERTDAVAPAGTPQPASPVIHVEVGQLFGFGADPSPHYSFTAAGDLCAPVTGSAQPIAACGPDRTLLARGRLGSGSLPKLTSVTTAGATSGTEPVSGEFGLGPIPARIVGSSHGRQQTATIVRCDGVSGSYAYFYGRPWQNTSGGKPSPAVVETAYDADGKVLWTTAS
jgi:hypothetical protein